MNRRVNFVLLVAILLVLLLGAGNDLVAKSIMPGVPDADRLAAAGALPETTETPPGTALISRWWTPADI